MVIMRSSYGSVLVLGALGIGGACGGDGRPCEETFTCGQGAAAGTAGSSGKGGSAGTAGRGGAGGSSGGKTGGAGGSAGAVLGGEGGEAGDPTPGGSSGTSGKGGGNGGTGGSAGKGGGGNGGKGGSPTFSVVSVTPGPDDVEPDAPIVITFSGDVDETTVAPSTIELLGDGTPLAGTLEPSGDTVMFTPTARLRLLADYTVHVADTVASLAGPALAEDYEASFTVRDGVWSEPVVVEGTSGTTLSAMGADAQGNVLVGWSDDSGVYARWYRPGKGWDPKVTVVACSNCFNDVQVSVNPKGDAIVAYKGTYARLYRDGAWGSETVTATGNATRFAVAMAPNGEAHVVAGATNALPVHTDAQGVFVSSGGLTWGESLSEPLSLGFDDAGNGIAMWLAPGTGLRYKRYNPTQGSWTTAVTLAGTSAAAGFGLAVTPAGRAIAVWTDASDVVASTFTAASGWSDAVPVDELDGAVGQLVVSTAPRGFLVAWAQAVDGVTTNLYSNRLVDDIWSGPDLRSDGVSSVQGTFPPLVRVDASGNAQLVWRSASSSYDQIITSRFDASSDRWSAPRRFFDFDTLYGFPPESLAVAGSGVAGLAVTGARPASQALHLSFFE